MTNDMNTDTWQKTPDGIPIPPPSNDDVLTETTNNIRVITLNRPLVLNALNKNVQRLLLDALQKADADDAVSVVILTGAGRAFSAGGDMWSHLYPDDEPGPSGTDVQTYIWKMNKPVIAAIRGHAVGQGFELAGVCDFTIASENVKLGEIQIRHGFGIPMLITPFLVGLKKAKEILMLGETLTAQEALNLGLINKIVADEDLMPTANTWAEKLSKLPQNTVRSNKAIIRRVYELAGFDDAIMYQDVPEIAALIDKGDANADRQHKIREKDGWTAFKEVRDQDYVSSD